MKTASERKRNERLRKRADGYVLKQIWVKPERWDKIKKFIGRENNDNK